MKRDAFLARVRTAVASGSLPSAPEGAGPLVWAPPPGDLVDRFAGNLRAVDGVVHRAAPHDVPGVVLRILGDHDVAGVLSWDAEHLAVPAVLDVLTGAGIERIDPVVPSGAADRVAHQLSYGAVAAGLTGASAGLAESGSIVLESGPGRSRMASLIPLLHVALLRAEDFHASLSHFAAAHPDTARSTANLVIVTGPSRTSDIETHLNLGVHGPRYLHVVVVEEPRAAGPAGRA